MIAELKRYFIGIPLPKEVRVELYRISMLMKKVFVGKASWVPLNNYHITLLFLGDKTMAEITSIYSLLEQLHPKGPSEMRLSNIGFFPNKQYIRIIWAGVEPDGPIIDKYTDICGILRTKGDKRFIPHITLSRVKLLSNRDVFVSRLPKFQPKQLKFKIDAFNVYSSILTPHGAEYTLEKSFTF